MKHDDILRLIGLARRAGQLEVGEEPVGSAARAHQAKLLLLAADAASNTYRRAGHFGQAGNVLWLETPFTKEELGRSVGRTSCAMMAVTDAGFAAAIAKKLQEVDPERYSPACQALEEKARKVMARRREMLAHEKNLQRGKGHKKSPTLPEKKAAASAPRPPAVGKGKQTHSGVPRPRPKNKT